MKIVAHVCPVAGSCHQLSEVLEAFNLGVSSTNMGDGEYDGACPLTLHG